jgi:hypothetical protein
MRRSIPLLVGLAVLLAAGAVHGLWTERWLRSAELDEAPARMASLADDLGPWNGQPAEQEEEEVRATGAVGHWGRFFTHKDTGQTVQVLLLCGKPGRMAAHRPEHCYRGAGFTQAEPATRVEARLADGRQVALWAGTFTKEEPAGLVRLRIFWSWGASGSWVAPDAPRLALAGHQAVYKLYLIQELHGPGPDSIAEEPCVDLLGQLLPELNRTLFPGG